MPEIRSYTVTQEREVVVAASSPAEAVAKAQELFDGITPPARSLEESRATSINARESY